MNPLEFPPVAAVLDAAHTAFLALVHLLEPFAGSAAAALSIVLVTLIVRTILIPVGIAQARAEQQRARLAPQLKVIRTRYAKQPERLQRETMRMYADEGVSPVAGCVPLLLQAPVLALVYSLFITPTIAGHPNALLEEALAGVSLRTSVVGAIGGGAVTPEVVIVFGVIVALLLALAEATRRLLPIVMPSASDTAAGPMGDAAARMASMSGFLHYMTAVIALFVPLAAALYLVATATWTLGQRLILRRRFPVAPPSR